MYRVEHRKYLLIRHAHTISPVTLAFVGSMNTSQALPPIVAQNFCSLQRFSAYPATSPRRKIYDAFLFSNELDWLEIRLETLFSSIDYFVIVESPTTFTGLAKPLILKDNWSRVEKFQSKIIYHVMSDPTEGAKTTWDVERYQRNALLTHVFPLLTGAQTAHKHDIIVISDVDEIPRPASMVVLRNCDVPTRVTLQSQFYYYSFQWLRHGEQWPHGQATIFGGLKAGQTVMPEELRFQSEKALNWWNSAVLWNAGWHCSTCFKTTDEVLTKMSSFSHSRWNKEEFRNKDRIIDRVRSGKDIWDRPGQEYDRVEKNEDVPEFIKKDRKRWAYLLDRDGQNAGFEDT